MNKLPNVYYRAAFAAYVFLFIAVVGYVSAYENTPFFTRTIDTVIATISFFVAMWQHALRFKYNPKERGL
jgi:hypothetical protein